MTIIECEYCFSQLQSKAKLKEHYISCDILRISNTELKPNVLACIRYLENPRENMNISTTPDICQYCYQECVDIRHYSKCTIQRISNCARDKIDSVIEFLQSRFQTIEFSRQCKLCDDFAMDPKYSFCFDNITKQVVGF